MANTVNMVPTILALLLCLASAGVKSQERNVSLLCKVRNTSDMLILEFDKAHNMIEVSAGASTTNVKYSGTDKEFAWNMSMSDFVPGYPAVPLSFKLDRRSLILTAYIAMNSDFGQNIIYQCQTIKKQI